MNEVFKFNAKISSSVNSTNNQANSMNNNSQFFSNSKEELEYYKRNYKSNAEELKSCKSKIKVLENLNNKLKEKANYNSNMIKNNDSSTMFYTNSEFKKIWESIIQTELIDNFDYCIKEYKLISNIIQDMILLVYFETKKIIDTKFQEMLKCLNLIKATGEKKNGLYVKILPFFRENFINIFEFSESNINSINQNLTYIIKDYDIENDLINNSLNKINSNIFNTLYKSFFKICLYMLLHDPILSFHIDKYSQRKLIYNYYTKKEHINVEGFGTEHTPCIILLPPPLIKNKFIFNGLRSAVYILSDTISNTNEIYQQCELNEKTLKANNHKIVLDNEVENDSYRKNKSCEQKLLNNKMTCKNIKNNNCMKKNMNNNFIKNENINQNNYIKIINKSNKYSNNNGENQKFYNENNNNKQFLRNSTIHKNVNKNRGINNTQNLNFTNNNNNSLKNNKNMIRFNSNNINNSKITKQNLSYNCVPNNFKNYQNNNNNNPVVQSNFNTYNSNPNKIIIKRRKRKEKALPNSELISEFGLSKNSNNDKLGTSQKFYKNNEYEFNNFEFNNDLDELDEIIINNNCILNDKQNINNVRINKFSLLNNFVNNYNINKPIKKNMDYINLQNFKRFNNENQIKKIQINEPSTEKTTMKYYTTYSKNNKNNSNDSKNGKNRTCKKISENKKHNQNNKMLDYFSNYDNTFNNTNIYNSNTNTNSNTKSYNNKKFCNLIQKNNLNSIFSSMSKNYNSEQNNYKNSDKNLKCRENQNKNSEKEYKIHLRNSVNNKNNPFFFTKMTPKEKNSDKIRPFNQTTVKISGNENNLDINDLITKYNRLIDERKQLENYFLPEDNSYINSLNNKRNNAKRFNQQDFIENYDNVNVIENNSRGLLKKRNKSLNCGKVNNNFGNENYNLMNYYLNEIEVQNLNDKYQF